MAGMSKEAMTFAGLQAFARRVAKQLIDTKVPTITSPAGVTGWLVISSRDMEENVIHKLDGNTELQFVSDEVWLRSDGVLIRLEIQRYVVIGYRGSNETVNFVASELSESQARERDGRLRWSQNVDRSPRGVSREERHAYFTRPADDRPAFLTLSAALARLRKGDGPVWEPPPQAQSESKSVEQPTSRSSAPSGAVKATERHLQTAQKNWFRRLLGM